MHELAITEEVVRIVTDKAAAMKASRVASVELVLGVLSGIVPDSVSFYFEHFSQGTPCQGARLDFVRVSAVARCRGCQHQFEPGEFDWTCPECGHLGADIVAGKELAVASIELE